jgi:iron complex transport system substrate-binding protein
MRIVSLLPSATEILFALGLDAEVVGVSHECDYPAQARERRVVIHSRIPAEASAEEIDRLVREYVSDGESLYSVDAQALEDLSPDLIITQDLCHVCAASPHDLASALARFSKRPEVLCLNPQDLGDVWRDILWVGEATCRGRAAEALLESIGGHLERVENAVTNAPERPRVAFLEWLQPFYVGGHWVPEMIELAGGMDVLGSARKASFRVSQDDIVAAQPEVLLISPCGYRAERARGEYWSISRAAEWNAIPAVRNGRIYALEANSYFSRPGPRLITGIEALAKICHSAIQVSPEAEAAILPLTSEAQAFRAGSS